MTEPVLTLVVVLAALILVGSVAWVQVTNRRWERTVDDIRQSAEQEQRRSQAAARDEIDRVRATAVRSTEAAVRSVSSTLVGMAAKTSRKVSDGVRTHQDDDAFETLVDIDHTVQQMLLAGQGWTVLAGGKLTRHWPTTTLTDVVRSAMGYVEGYDRVRTHELDIAVRTRVVGPVVHTIAILLDNALSFSPPQSRVHVSFEQGHHGVIVVVDDSGLQMTPEQLGAARDILTGHRGDDITQLGARPQTGFRVAAALAAAYGFRVDVQAPNSLLGTRALLVLPHELLTTMPQAAPAASSARPPSADAERAPLRPVPAAATRPVLSSVPAPEPVPVPEPASVLSPRPASAQVPAAADAPASAPADGRAAPLVPAQAAPPVVAPTVAPAPPVADHPASQRGADGAQVRTTASGLAVRTRRKPVPAAPPASRPVNAEPGRASVIASWARGTERARAEAARAEAAHVGGGRVDPHDTLAPYPQAVATDQGHDE